MKCKFTDARITDIAAILDVDEESGKYILTFDDESFELNQILDAHVGDEITIKFTKNLA